MKQDGLTPSNAVSFSLCSWVDAHGVNRAAFQLKGTRRRGKKSLFLVSLLLLTISLVPFSLPFWLDTGQDSTDCFAFVGCTVLQFLQHWAQSLMVEYPVFWNLPAVQSLLIPAPHNIEA